MDFANNGAAHYGVQSKSYDNRELANSQRIFISERDFEFIQDH